MSSELVTIWHCDADCAASAPEKTDGWADAIYTHGCPEHGEVISTHKAIVDYETRGRGYREKTTWWLRCACGWKPTPSRAVHSSYELQGKHRRHVLDAAKTVKARAA